MAGNGGFKSALNGFDKNEVNEYIGNLRRKLQEMEADIKSNEEKTRAAVKTAEEADSKIAELEKKHAERVSELEALAKTERRNADTLQNENDELKRKLRHANSGASSGASSAAAAAEAEKKASEVIAKANAQAKEIVEKAKQTAHEIIASAGANSAQSGGVSAKSAEEFGAILKELSKSVTDALNAAGRKASEITGGAVSAPVPELDLSAFEAPSAEVPMSGGSKPAAAPSSSESASMDDLFANMMDDGDMSDMSDFGDIKPLDPHKPKHEVVEGFDLSDVGKFDETDAVTEVSPIDEKAGGAVMDDGFTAELLTQTVPSSALKDQVDEDLFAAVKEREEEFAVKPSDDEKDFDMDDAAGGLDAMNALLGQMGAALENAGGTGSLDLDAPASEPAAADSSASDNPWADLQNQLNAMEESGNFGGDEGSGSGSSPEPEAAPAEDPKAPDADDSSIWNFDSDMGGDSSDDDMSSDLFGSF